MSLAAIKSLRALAPNKWFSSPHSALRENDKTILGFDLTSICPNRFTCHYCYAQQPMLNGASKRARKEVGQTYYEPGFLVKNRNLSRIQRVLKFGLRGNVSSDFPTPHPDKDPSSVRQLRVFLDDCAAIGMVTRFNTRLLEWLPILLAYEHVRLVLPVDDFCGIDHDRARELRETYPHRVRLRAMCHNEGAIERYVHWADVVTLFHVPQGGMNTWMRENDFQAMGHRTSAFKRAAEKYPTKVCCQTGSCESCPVACGYGRN